MIRGSVIPSLVASYSVKLMVVSFANNASEELYLAAYSFGSAQTICLDAARQVAEGKRWHDQCSKINIWNAEHDE